MVSHSCDPHPAITPYCTLRTNIGCRCVVCLFYVTLHRPLLVVLALVPGVRILDGMTWHVVLLIVVKSVMDNLFAELREYLLVLPNCHLRSQRRGAPLYDAINENVVVWWPTVLHFHFSPNFFLKYLSYEHVLVGSFPASSCFSPQRHLGFALFYCHSTIFVTVHRLVAQTRSY